jgi:hypothetical protein
MPDLANKLLNRIGVADAMAHRAKQTAKKLNQAAGKHHDAANAEVEDLAKQIEKAGVGAQPDLEERYCQALVTRGHMAQAHTLAEQDAARMPEVGEDLEKSQQSFSFDEEKHPRDDHGEFATKAGAGFKEWFGNSKVVDTEGKPLVVYHGSPEKFEAFDPSKASPSSTDGPGFYFATDRTISEEYANPQDPATGEIREGGHVLKVHLKIENPWKVEEPLSKEEWSRVQGALPKGGILLSDLDARKRIQAHFKHGQPNRAVVFNFFRSLPEEKRHAARFEVRNALESLGYDGVVTGFDSDEHRIWVAWHPEQIQSADNAGIHKGRINPRKAEAAGQVAMGFDEEEHPREPKGDAEHHGGRFARKDRTDIHRPSELVPENYEYVASSFPVETTNPHTGGTETKEEWEGTPEWHAMGQPKQSTVEHARVGHCDHCGASHKYQVLLRHQGTGELVSVGHECYENRFSVEGWKNRVAGASRREELRQQREVNTAAALGKMTPDQKEAYDWATSGAEGVHPTAEDLARKVPQFGPLSDRQAEFLAKLHKETVAKQEAEAAARENATPCPRGKHTVTGTILGFKTTENAYGITTKMIVLDDRGFKVYGSRPAAFSRDGAEKGDRVSFTADLEPSQDDELFGFFSRPAKTSILTGAPDRAFKEWFGNSKVVDEEGQPQVVYPRHG